MTPNIAGPVVVRYPRGGLVEQYLARANSVEQQFVIPQPPVPAGADLVIAGAVSSKGITSLPLECGNPGPRRFLVASSLFGGVPMPASGGLPAN